ncbi:MAG: AEC family transporter [Eggerthella lenta]
MTVEMVEIFLQILILLAFGFLFSKRDIITDSMKNGLSTLLLKAVLPLVILSSSQVAFDGSVLQGFVVTMAVSLVFYVVVVGGLGLVRKRIPIPDGGNRIFVLLCAYGNDGFIGIPLAMQFFGSAGMLYAIAANIVFNITLFSFGIAVLQDKAKPDIKGILLNPCLICTVVALVLYALPFRFPTPITDAFNMAGSMMTPLAMFIIGYEMSRMKLSDVVRDKWAYIVSFMPAGLARSGCGRPLVRARDRPAGGFGQRLPACYAVRHAQRHSVPAIRREPEVRRPGHDAKHVPVPAHRAAYPDPGEGAVLTDGAALPARRAFYRLELFHVKHSRPDADCFP